MTIFAVCSNCGREFPLPISGRGRCISCVIAERRGRATRPMPPDPRDRRGHAVDRRGPDRRTRTDRRIPDVILADRRVIPMVFATGERRAGRLERRVASDRRVRTDRRSGTSDRRVSWYTAE